MFLGVLIQDGSGETATVQDAESYARQHRWNFPALADTREDMWKYSPQPATPIYMAIDGSTMKIMEAFNGGFTGQADRRAFVQRNRNRAQ